MNDKSEFIKAIRFIFLTALFYGFMFWSQIRYNLFVPYSLFIFTVVALLILVRPRQGFAAFVFAVILSETHFLYGYEFFQSIYTFKIAGFSLIDFLLFLLIFRMLFHVFLTGQIRWQTTVWDRGFLVVSGMVILYAIIGPAFGATLRNWLVDVKAMLFLIAPFFMVRFFMRDGKDIVHFFQMIVYVLLGKIIVYFVGYLIKFGLTRDLVVRVTLTSDVVFYPVILLICLVIYLQSAQKGIKWTALVLAIITFLDVFWSFGREAWFWTFISVILFGIVAGGKIKIRIFKIMAVTAILTAVMITVIRPQTWEYAVTSIKTFSLKTTGKGEEETGAVRAIEWVNVHKLLAESNTVLIGRGMGATWNDRFFALPKKRDIYSFPITETEHVFTHMVFSKFYLKFGLLGSLIIWASLIIPWVKTIKWSGKLPDQYRRFLLAILMGCIGVFAKLEIIRVALIGGLILGAISSVIISFGENEN